mmetsp:Transcript_32083/g.55355  ORF Transcript_32083/g.55355 Transcript_32083/m.55355 type:complete len:142 (+) Transcript_32083:1879-2304(+)
MSESNTSKLDKKVEELIEERRENYVGKVTGFFKPSLDLGVVSAQLKAFRNRFKSCPDNYAEVCEHKVQEIDDALGKISGFNKRLYEVCDSPSVTEKLLCQDKARRLMNLQAMRTLKRSEETWKRFEEIFSKIDSDSKEGAF